MLYIPVIEIRGFSRSNAKRIRFHLLHIVEYQLTNVQLCEFYVKLIRDLNAVTDPQNQTQQKLFSANTSKVSNVGLIFSFFYIHVFFFFRFNDYL